MANSSKRLLSDQVMYYLSSGYPDVADAVQQEDVYKRIEQVVNSMFSMQQFSVNLPSGGTIPNNLAIATYEGVAVTVTNSNKSKSLLPVMPISLPRNAGINEIRPVISDIGDRILGNPMIPLQAGQGYLLKSDTLLNDLMGQISYEISGRQVVYQSDITLLGITKVDMKLVVFDMSQYAETDILPIPSDAEDDIVKEVIKFFAPVQADQALVSNLPTPKPNDQ